MNDKSFISRTQESERDKSGLGERGWITLFCLVCLVVIFGDLGGTALFGPNEGRNAEKVRETLLLGDWVTPHENFLATLDKPLIAPEDQMAFYGTYLEGIPFYLRIHRPIWLAEARRRADPRANSYVAMRRRVPTPEYGQVVFAYNEFAEQWKRTEKVLKVFLKETSLARFSGEVGGPPRTLAKRDEYLLVTSR